jgi:hypothetical protein
MCSVLPFWVRQTALAVRSRAGGLSPPDETVVAGGAWAADRAMVRLDGGPFKIAEFVAHDPRLRLRSFNHVSGSHQSTIASRAVTNALNLLPLSVHSGHGRTCCWHDQVANDLKRTPTAQDFRNANWLLTPGSAEGMPAAPSPMYSPGQRGNGLS